MGAWSPVSRRGPAPPAGRARPRLRGSTASAAATLASMWRGSIEASASRLIASMSRLLDTLQRSADGRLELLGILAGPADFAGMGIDFPHRLGNVGLRFGQVTAKFVLVDTRLGHRLADFTLHFPAIDPGAAQLCPSFGDRTADLGPLGGRQIFPLL